LESAAPTYYRREKRFFILIRLCRESRQRRDWLITIRSVIHPIGHGMLARQSLWRGTDDFLGSEWTKGRVLSVVLTVQIFRLKHIRLEPDGLPARRASRSESDWCGSD